MDRVQTFEQFLAGQAQLIDLEQFFVNLLIAAVLAFLLAQFYERFGNTYSMRESFSRLFVPLTLITMIVISIVKSSLALSLGLVGALSIVRFRAAIKDPEELVYLFFCIAVGLGLGANQRTVTVVGLLFGLAAMYLLYRMRGSSDTQNLFLTVSGEGSDQALTSITEAISARCESLSLRRLDDTDDRFEVSFDVRFKSVDQLDECVRAIRDIAPASRVNLIENILR